MGKALNHKKIYNPPSFSQRIMQNPDEIKERKFLRDSAQNPAIRVALREIRDFALPFKSGDEIVWRYFLVPESEFKITEKKPEKLLEIEVKKPVLAVADKEKQKPLDIFSKESKEEPETKPKKRKSYK